METTIRKGTAKFTGRKIELIRNEAGKLVWVITAKA